MKKIKVLYDNSINDYIHILIYICDRCNYTCEYCYNARPRTLILMDLNILLSFLINIKINTRKKIYIEIIGGEPTLHPDLLDFCKKCNTYTNITISVYTNFSQSIDYYIQLL
jgi:molybdenum cofactor biosynthesis enzyme MoaA